MTRCVYFIGPRADATAPIKIGTTRNLGERLKLIQNGNHLELFVIASVDGSYAEEALIHRAFCRQHIRNEWFSRTEALNDFIGRLLIHGFEHERSFLSEKATSGWGINTKSAAGIERIRAGVAGGAMRRRSEKEDAA